METISKRQDCPLCGFQFETGEAACGGCPMSKGCGLLRCPNCHYEFTGEPKLTDWFKKILKKRGCYE